MLKSYPREFIKLKTNVFISYLKQYQKYLLKCISSNKLRDPNQGLHAWPLGKKKKRDLQRQPIFLIIFNEKCKNSLIVIARKYRENQ